MSAVDSGLLRLMAEELVRMAHRNERLASGHGERREGFWLQGKAEGLRYAADAITELVEPALKPPLRSVK